MSNELVSFTCDACEATLNISVELAGVSGPCPCCGKVVTSPPAERFPELQLDAIPRDTKESNNPKPRDRFQAQVTSGDETGMPVRPRPTGWLVAAGFAVFAGGITGVWKFWEKGNQPRTVPQSGMAMPLRPLPKPRPEVLAAADDDVTPAALLSPPANKIPRTLLVPGADAIARDVATSPSASGPVATGMDSRPVVRPAPAGDPGVTPTQTLAAAAAMSAAERQIREAVPLVGYLEKPGTAVVRFFAATTWQERLKYSLAPDKVKPLMEAHYREYADGPIIPEDVELVRVESVEEDHNRKYFAFNVYMPGVGRGTPLSVEETVNGCLVEWCSFIEGKDRLLEKFYAGYRKEPGTFRVLVRRGHYFDDDVPDQDQKSYFSVRPPDGTGPFPLWAERDSVVHTRHFSTGERSRWDISSMMVLKLQWEKTSDGVEYVRLQDVVADSWHPGNLPK